jgi:hypothetical protein
LSKTNFNRRLVNATQPLIKPDVSPTGFRVICISRIASDSSVSCLPTKNHLKRVKGGRVGSQLTQGPEQSQKST